MSGPRGVRASLVAGAILAAAACGAHAARGPESPTTAAHPRPSAVTTSSGSVARGTPDGDWTTFDYDAQRSGVGPARTGITAAAAPHLARRAIHIDGVADSAPIQLHALRVRGRVRDVAIVTTTYGRTIAFDPGTGAKLWEFAPADIRSYQGGSRVTVASPAADPNRRYVYAASPDGLIHKLSIATGRQAWSSRITFDPRREKIEGALNISGPYVIATTGGYYGDQPVYQGHVALLSRASGRVVHVFNALCSDRRRLIDPPSSCPASDAAIWARAGAIVEPRTGRLIVATGNGPFNGATEWGDSALVLSPDARRILHTWTPRDQARLNATDTDLGSSAPALLPGGLAVQGGKSGELALLDLARQGIGGTGGELQTLPSPGGGEVLTAPAVSGDRVFIADDSGTAAYVLRGVRLHLAWQNGDAGTSPVLAGGLLYIYDERAGALRVLRPATGATVATLPAARGHWSSPVVVGGRVILPVGGSTTDDALGGTVFVYHAAGR